jgi:hypothetical protein
MRLLKGSSINTVHEVVRTVAHVFIPKRDLKQSEASGIAMSKIHLPICDDRTKSAPVTELLQVSDSTYQPTNQPTNQKKQTKGGDLYEAKVNIP